MWQLWSKTVHGWCTLERDGNELQDRIRRKCCDHGMRSSAHKATFNQCNAPLVNMHRGKYWLQQLLVCWPIKKSGEMLHFHEWVINRASREANGHGPYGIIPIHFTVSLPCSLVMDVSTITVIYIRQLWEFIALHKSACHYSRYAHNYKSDSKNTKIKNARGTSKDNSNESQTEVNRVFTNCEI